MYKIIASILLSSTILFCMPLQAEEEKEEKEEVVKTQWLLVHAGSLLAVPGESLLSEKTVVIKDGLIDQVLDGYVSSDEVVGDDENAVVDFLDLSDSYVLPGLLDMHVHQSFEFDVKGQKSYGAADPYS